MVPIVLAAVLSAPAPSSPSPTPAAATTPAATTPSTATRPQLIRDVRLFDGERVREHASVLVANGHIATIGGPEVDARGADMVDGRGMTLMPGLIDAHVHLPDQAETASRQALRLGVTTQLDMFSIGERFERLKRLRAEDRTDLADLRTAGLGATVPGGHPTQMGGPRVQATLTTPGEAQAFVDARIAEGSDYIKVIHDEGGAWSPKPVPTLDLETVRALVDAAHKRNKLAVVHVSAEAEARRAIAAGADGLVHMFVGETASPDFGRLAAGRGVFVISTLSAVQAFVCGRTQGPRLLDDARLAPLVEPSWQRGLAMLKPDLALDRKCRGADDATGQLIRAGADVVAGTDAPSPGTAYGASLHGELALLVGRGMTPVQALAAATSVTARRFRLDDRGRVRPGLRADLVLVKGDPTTDILATRDIVAVWKRGVRVRKEFDPRP
jgi:imidazolonepropionase-like amidohydrolase